VNALVLTDPTNAEYLELQRSLIEGITLATTLVRGIRASLVKLAANVVFCFVGENSCKSAKQ
jgi:hypothetical protein